MKASNLPSLKAILFGREKRMINGRFKGVATKYLNNYVVWHNLVNFANGGKDEKEMVMRDFTLTTKCLSFWKKNLDRPAIPVAA